MNATHDRAKSIFLTAAEIASAEERRAFIESQCAGDERLRGEVDELLRHQQSLGSFLEAPAVDLATTTDFPPITERPGTVIGPYKLLQQIGEGGMGVVFMAEQSEPIQRTVALKIINPGMDTRQVIARFEAERQALALMDHPNIARVLDAGTTDAGRPYFVMDLVKGVPITEYCDSEHLTVRKRLELMIQVCQAVQHAHQKGIIHRDLKPSNVLVAEYDGRPVPKIIDFGVAKATAQRLTERTMFTEYGQLIGTFEYMSPEQARFNQLDIDTRSDIYSLGVLLYELLTGSTPFEKGRLETTPFDETLRIIREEEPPKPSTRLSRSGLPSRTSAAQGPARQAGPTDLATIAANRQTEPARLSRLVRGELDWIVMKCLEKDRNRRYETASALAADIQHYLKDEPLTAVPPSRMHRASKFVRRNKWPVIAAGALVAGLVAALIGTTIGLVSQSRLRILAERERAEAQLNLGVALQSRSKYREAEELYRQGLETLSRGTPEDRQRAAHAMLQLAQVVPSGKETERLYREAIRTCRTAYPPNDPNIAHALTAFAIYLRDRQRYAEAEPFFREAYDIHHQIVPIDHHWLGASAVYLGNLLNLLGRYVEAEPLLREAVAEYQLESPPQEWLITWARMNLARNLVVQQRFAEAESLYFESLPRLQNSSGSFIATAEMTGLYTMWDKAEPGQGYDAKAQQWFHDMLDEIYPHGTMSDKGK